MRIRDPRTTALVFSSGKMVCTGAKRQVRLHSKVCVCVCGGGGVCTCVCVCVYLSVCCVSVCNVHACVHTCSEDLSRLAARKYARIIQKLGFPVREASLVYLSYKLYILSHDAPVP